MQFETGLVLPLRFLNFTLKGSQREEYGLVLKVFYGLYKSVNSLKDHSVGTGAL